nr:MAG TPA: hypothetical protein [Caudoviricetes sp.]
MIYLINKKITAIRYVIVIITLSNFYSYLTF